MKRSFISAHNRLSEKEELTYEEYYTVAALILATMEIESNFKDIVCYNNNGSIDYGTMQVNTAIIPEIEKNLGKLDIKNSIEDNIEAGSWEIYECYKKAKDKHPENVLWYTYAYYNRGLYFENYSYNYEQANTRSIKFIEKFNKYYSDGIISKVYSTNLTYISPELREAKWFNAVDMSEFLSRVINRLNYGKSIAKYMDATRIIRSLLK